MSYAFKLRVAFCVVCLAAANVRAQLWPPVVDDRNGVVATETAGWGGPVVPLRGPTYFDSLGMRWWYNYIQDSASVYPGYHKLYMYWKATATASAAQIRAAAAAAAAAYPGETIWWALSNEPNDRGQANQSATAFADIYYLYHSNLKLGDPNCKVMGAGILNWDFLSTSVWQKGKEWYEEFRQAWFNNPAYRAYSETHYGVSYPPQDAFNLHTYDLRGVQGTPWAAEDWRYSRDQILMCYQDLLTYPEVLRKQIWLSEFAALRCATMAENVVLTRQLVGWMRDQPFMERWFYFTIHSDQYWGDTSPPRLELLDENGQPTAVGQSAYELATLPLEVKVDPNNGHYAGDPAVSYLRTGTSPAVGINDAAGGHPRFELVQNSALTMGTMQGRTITAGPGRLIRKVVFQYMGNYDNTKVKLVLDRISTSGAAQEIWSLNQYGGHSGSGTFTFTTFDRICSLGIGMTVPSSFTYTNATAEWFGELSNVVLFSEPDRHLIALDFDQDGDVDQEDFGHFQSCLTGRGVPQTSPACADAHLMGRPDVTEDDMALMLRCLSGPDIPTDPNCLN